VAAFVHSAAKNKLSLREHPASDSLRGKSFDSVESIRKMRGEWDNRP